MNIYISMWYRILCTTITKKKESSQWQRCIWSFLCFLYYLYQFRFFRKLFFFCYSSIYVQHPLPEIILCELMQKLIHKFLTLKFRLVEWKKKNTHPELATAHSNNLTGTMLMSIILFQSLNWNTVLNKR